jgi:hypothetical protein
MVMSSYLLEYASLPTGYLQSRSSEVPSRRPAMGELAGASDLAALTSPACAPDPVERGGVPVTGRHRPPDPRARSVRAEHDGRRVDHLHVRVAVEREVAAARLGLADPDEQRAGG